jgi:hypothetical protein
MMVRWLALVLVMTATAAAPAPNLPVPPIPPANPPRYLAAPVPNVDARAPSPVSQEGAQLSPYLFRYNNYDPSVGYTPGSRVQTSDDRKILPVPGFTLRVPIQ